MNPSKAPSEIRMALGTLGRFFKPAAWFSVVMSFLLLAPSIYMLEVYDRVINSKSHMTLAMLTLFVLGSFVLLEFLDWIRAELMRQAGLAFDRLMSRRVFDAIFEANLKCMPGGSLQSMSDFRDVRDFLHAPALLAVMDSPASVLFLILVFAISPVLGWATVVSALIQTAVAWMNERGTYGPMLSANRSSNAAQLYAESSLRNSQVIESMGMLANIHHRWMSKQREFLKFQFIASEHSGVYQAVSKFVQNTVASMLLGLGAWLVLRNQLNGGPAFMIVGSILGGRVLTPLLQITAQWQVVLNARNSYARLDVLLRMVPVRTSDMALPAPRGLLQVDSLIAGAPGGTNAILKNINFTLQPGEVLAVVGPSAAGKSTMARLLVGLWPAQNGKVRLDGADVYAWDKNELGPYIGYLPQGVDLFEGSIASNIARFGDIDLVKVEAAARAVGLHEFIMCLPDGYESSVGREGTILSGGQRQRVGLARAIYSEPAFVVLDEPNSSLDQQGDTALINAIAQLKAKGTTFVVMTHRTSVFSVTDKVLVLRDGVAQMFGARDVVLSALPSPHPA